MVKSRSELFFAIDGRQLPKLWPLGLNAVVGYLILASGTGGDQSTTFWSIAAIEGRSGIGRRRAKVLIEDLCNARLMTVDRSKSRPCYKIKLSKEPDFIFLPNSLIDGVGAEIPPVERLRRRQSLPALRMLIEAYAIHDLPTEGGIDWRLIHRQYERCEMAERGLWKVFGFTKGNFTAPWSSPLRKQFGQKCNADENRQFWDTFETLDGLGLVEIVPHLVESKSHDAEIITPCPIDTGTVVEKQVQPAINAAFNAMFQGSFFEVEAQNYDHISIVSIDQPAVEMVGIVRLVYRPHTGATKAWFAQSERIKEYVDGYTELRRRALFGLELGNSLQKSPNVQHQRFNGSKLNQ